jgi:cytochrome P450
MSDDLIRDQLLTMLIAGHDTSTASLSWTLYLLGRHPEAMARLQTETDAVLADTDNPPEVDQLGQLAYLDLVFKEALRLYPPIHVGNRRTSQEMSIAGYAVPAPTLARPPSL